MPELFGYRLECGPLPGKYATLCARYKGQPSRWTGRVIGVSFVVAPVFAADLLLTLVPGMLALEFGLNHYMERACIRSGPGTRIMQIAQVLFMASSAYLGLGGQLLYAARHNAPLPAKTGPTVYQTFEAITARTAAMNYRPLPAARAAFEKSLDMR